jgi:hypothetical protein
MVVDVITTLVQQYKASPLLSTSLFNIAPRGSGWTLSPATSPTRCLDAGAATNFTGLVVNACNGSASQSWNITANPQNGSFRIATASTGRCMNVRGNSTAAGAVMEVYDCNPGSTSQMFNVQAR